MKPDEIEQAFIQLLVELEQPNEHELNQMSAELDHLIERECDRLEREYPNHWRVS